MNNFRALIIGVSLLLTACQGTDVGRTLGITRTAPDEFAVIARPPLSVPPEFDLKPPTSSAQSTSEDTAGKARSIVNGTVGMEIQSGELPSFSKTDQNLLTKAGLNSTDPKIREKLEADTVQSKDKEKKGMLDKILGSDEKDEKKEASPAPAE